MGFPNPPSNTPPLNQALPYTAAAIPVLDSSPALSAAAAAERLRSAAEGATLVEASLARLRELALALPRPGCDWEERPRFDPPASPAAVAAFERAAGFLLPADLRAFLADTGAVVGLSVHNGYWVGGVEQLTQSMARGDVPRSVSGELAAPVATDGGGNAFLLSSTGRVWRWDHETGRVSEVAESFAAFLERVVADWAAFVADTPGWQFLV